MVCASEKYASEIEIFTFGKVFQTRISRSRMQKRRFHQSMIRQFGLSDFFNRIGRFLPVVTGSNRPKLCKNDLEQVKRSEPERYWTIETTVGLAIPP
jgi:hypothetical protein